MSTLTLPPELESRLTQLAAWLSQSPELLVNEAVEEHLDLLNQRKLEGEIAAFRREFAALRARYADEFVALHEGAVVDHDREFEPLFLRVRERFGDLAVLIREVGAESDPEWRVGSPRVALDDDETTP